jgi:hypothetical protein
LSRCTLEAASRTDEAFDPKRERAGEMRARSGTMLVDDEDDIRIAAEADRSSPGDLP